MNILELAILKKMVGGGGGSGTDNYNDLSNLPQINGETLAGNKTAENLGLQDALTFDSTPTEDSTNPVESGGVFNALAGKQDNLTFDDDPTENSTNPVKSGGVYNALAGKQDNLTFDGVYNASTNKAATESTVTNAIAGLDVSALSVDADETISSISETDGKINVTKQDIAIASNQVTAMTGYTKPSIAPATPAIQTSDTANQAFGKLEFKADTNQTNILLVQDATKGLVDEGAKNIFDITTPDSLRDTTVTPLENGGAKLSCNNATWTQYHKSIATKIGEKYKVAVYIDSITGSIGSDLGIYVKRENAQDDDPYFELHPTSTGVYTADLTALTSVTTISIYINNSGTSKTLDVNMRVMVCSEADWKISQNFAPFALPNYDLTQLEAEDRAALVDVVDSGAKNLLDWANSEIATYNPYHATVSKTESSFTITSTDISAGYGFVMSLPKGEYVLTTTISNFSGSNSCWCTISVGSRSGNIVSEYTFTGNCNIELRFDLTQTSDVYINYYAHKTGTSYADTTSFTASNLMICTLAEWKVSKNFVSYALPNTDLTRLEAEDRASLAEVVDSGAKNLSSWNGGSLSTAGFIVRDYPITLTPGNYVIAYRTTATGGNTQLTLNSVSFVTLPNSNENRRVGFFTVDTTKTNFSLYSDSSNNTITDFMICTKAAFDVSPAYAPYRKNLDQLEATKAPALDTGAGVNSGSLDDVSENTFAIYTTNVSNLPTNTSYYYVETIVYSTGSSGYAIQKAYSVTDGTSYIRVKNTGTWSAWKQITNT